MIRRMGVNGKKSPLVTVAFLTRNGGAEFEETLKAVLSQKAPFEFEIVAIDSGSTDGTWEVSRKFKEQEKRKSITLVQIKPREFRHGVTRNEVMKMSRGKIVVFLVQDALPVGNNWLATLVGPILERTGTKIAGVSGRQVPPRKIALSQRYFLENSYTDQPRVMEGLLTEFGPGKIWFSNVCSAIVKDVWRKTPFPDVVMSEDQAWTREVLKRGYRLIYEPRARVIHGHNLSLYKLFKRNVDSGASLSGMGASVPTVGKGRIWGWLGKELKYGWEKEGARGVIKILTYEIVRFVGFQTGYRMWVPWQVKRFFSNVPQWWDWEKFNDRK